MNKKQKLKTMKHFIWIFFFLFTTPIFAQTIDMDDLRDDEPEMLAKWLEGSFTTNGQELQPHLKQHQNMRFVRLWHDLPDLWFYMEQSHADSPDKPFRQWVFMIEQQGEYQMFEMHTLPDPEAVVGKSAKELESLIDIGELYVVSGCELFLAFDGYAVFSGTSVEQYCELYLEDENHVSLQLHVTNNKLDWWETGKDEDDNYLWGNRDKPQIFTKN